MTFFNKLKEFCKNYFNLILIVSIVLIAAVMGALYFLPASSLVIGLNFLVLFVVCTFLGFAYSSRNSKEAFAGIDQELTDEVNAFKVTIEEIALEKKIILTALDQKFAQLDKLQTQQLSDQVFLKSDHQELAFNERLQGLCSNLKASMCDYPNFFASEATNKTYLANAHILFKEHHADVKVIGEVCFKEFDEYLSFIDHPIKELNKQLGL